MSHSAIKLVVITENFICREVCRIVEKCGAKGYTLVPAGGKGLHHFHPTADKATVVEAFANIKVEIICLDRAKAEKIADMLLEECFQDYPGVMYMENVEIWRPERF